MLQTLRLQAPKGRQLHSYLIARPSSFTASALSASPPLASIWSRGLKTTVEAGQPDPRGEAFYTQLNDDQLNKGLRHETSLSAAGKPFDVEYLRESMARRPHRATYDHLSPTHSHLLNIALYDVLPRSAQAGAIPDFQKAASKELVNPFALPVTKSATGTAADHERILPAGHHLVYYPLQRPISLLEPDGTDPAQSPGPPFVRRMWAGGSLHFLKPHQLALNGQRTVCVEGLDTKNMVMRGEAGREKIFVDVVRRYGTADTNSSAPLSPDQVLELEDGVWKDPALEERRTLVFLRAKNDNASHGGHAAIEAEAKARPKTQEERVIKANRAPQYSFSFTPTSTLLFQFSALSYNAHAIHLDVDYCRNVEGYRDLLVHGPLTLVLMLSALRGQLHEVVRAGASSSSLSTGHLPIPYRYIRKLDYRNLAPLYANEELKVCVHRNAQDPSRDGQRRGFSRWDVWVENSRGSICARGTAITCPDTREPTPRNAERPASDDDQWEDEWYYEE
ncbi:hypothetical protein HMPREF1624_04833 [Sporothrix schenckii ATCC 58251]|uniref:MaoC-like domain-containing protein n=1 Tax=Sporothrix schenckii (strain ATCC 58251 / de Perez 2211183) TaxID=1391915 RepID=U7PUB0_SPOS1|nr:hypothetical protein HMPREF1624_04833 [Sporothrix schenckii ATCC 58251]